MSAVLTPLWLLAVAAAAVFAVRAVRAGRRAPDETAPSSHVVSIVLTAVAIATGAAVIFGVGPAVRGSASIRGESATERTPARARLFLRQVRVDATPGRAARVGYSPDADVVLPALYRLGEAQRGWDLFDVTRAESAERITIGERARAEATATTIRMRGSAAPLALADRVQLLESCRSGTGPSEPADGRVVTVALCSGKAARAVLSFEALADATLLRPEVWRRGRLEPHHIEIDAGELVQIGTPSAAVPGVTLWQVPSPRDRSELFSAPTDLLGSCSAFASSVYTGASAAATSQSGAVCAVPFAPPFALEVRRLVPDVAGVTARAVWATGLLLMPLLGWALLLLLPGRTRATRRDVADFARFSVVTVTAAAVVGARLLWAHRIDMLRDWQVLGDRVHDNLVSTVAIATALALVAALAGFRAHRHRILFGLCAFFVTLLFGQLAIPGSLELDSGRVGGQFLLAAVIGSVALWSAHLPRLAELRPHWLTLAAAAAAVATRWFAPDAVALKLLLSTASIALCYRSLRHGMRAVSAAEPGDDSSVLPIAWAALSALALVLAVGYLDTGLAAVIAVPGLLVAAAIVGHDALFGDRAVAQVNSYRKRQLPLLWLQGGLLAVVATAVAVWSAVGLIGFAAGDVDATLARDLTAAAPHLLWVIAALFVAPALVARARGERTIMMWFGSAAAVVIGLWLLRDSLAELVLSSNAPAAQRYAVIADPGYALLSDPAAFHSGLTGWAETILGAANSSVSGEGYFGAQLIDPGVLLSIENDYLPILLLREQGVLGVALWSAFALGAIAIAWLVGRECFGLATAAARSRVAVAIVVCVLVVYQPLAALGAIPLTGISWLGLGIDSPADLWMFVGVLVFLAGVGQSAHGATEHRHERSLRRSRRFVRSERWVSGVCVLATVTGVLLVTRGATFASRRPPSVVERGVAREPFTGLEAALDYARSLSCERGDSGMSLSGEPSDSATERYHRKLRRVVEARGGSSGDIRVGLITLSPGTDGDRCDVRIDRRVLSALQVEPARPYHHKRVRLVSAPMGRAAGDLGELSSGGVVIRMRPSAPDRDVPAAEGLYAASQVSLAPGVSLITDGGRVKLERVASDSAGPAENWLFVSDGERAKVGLRSAEARARWSPVDPVDGLVELDRDALIVVGRGARRNVWLYRAARPSGADPNRVHVAPLLADDVRFVTGARRRLYPYGNDMPELGWVNPYRVSNSVGLDGWVSAAVSTYDPAKPTAPMSCGTLAPAAPDFSRVCRAVPGQDVLECQVSVQPELTVALRHLTEMIAAAPADFAPAAAWARPLRASFTLLRGDTGEIASQGSFVPGRASPAYAPTTAALETHLVRLREDRDPTTGARLPDVQRGEASAEKVEHNRPIAVGSVFKPMLARAFELSAPTFARWLTLVGEPMAAAKCRGGRVHAVLGHCPPTDSVWNQRRPLGVAGFVAHSANWFQASVGLLGTALPDGEVGFGAGEATPLDQFVMRNVGDPTPAAALWTKRNGRTVISARGAVDVAGLRKTPMWRRFEAVLGRPLCTLGNKSECARASIRRDMCAARAMPIKSPSADLRHLVATGPDRFDFYPRMRDKTRKSQTVPTREYLQFLRGSGVHPVGTLLQMADAFNRVVYEAGRDPLVDGPYELAASWFPVAAAGTIPDYSCTRGGSGDQVSRGLCDAVRTGTASRALSGRLSDSRIEIYGVKTGTIDSLGDTGSSERACNRFRDAHTLTDRRRAPPSQPYWLDCDERGEHDDSLLLVSFGVRTAAGGRVPLTLAIGFVRSGSGFASFAANHYLDVIADYFSGGERGLP